MHISTAKPQAHIEPIPRKPLELTVFDTSKDAILITATSTKSRGLSRLPLSSLEPRADDIYRFATEEYIQYPRMPLILSDGKLIIRSMARAAGIYVLVSSHDVLDIQRLSSELPCGTVELTADGQCYEPNLKCRAVGERDRECADGTAICTEQLLSELVGRLYSAVVQNAPSAIYHCAQTVSRLTGCALDISLHEHIDGEQMLDTDVLSAMLLLLLIMFRHEARERGALITLESASDSPIICLSARLYHDSPLLQKDTICAELAECRRIAERYNMMFDHMISHDGVLTVHFCPVLREWSRLGIKTTPELQY